MYLIVIFCFTWNNPKAFLFCVFCHKVPLYSKYFTLLFLWKAPLAVPANLIPICSHLQSEYKAPTIYINCTYSLKRDKQKIGTVLYSIFDFFKNYCLWIIKALMSRTLFNSWSSCLMKWSFPVFLTSFCESKLLKMLWPPKFPVKHIVLPQTWEWDVSWIYHSGLGRAGAQDQMFCW